MADFRALCAELVDDLEPWVVYGEIEAIEKSHDLIDRARATLAEPEPPADGEVAELVAWLRVTADGEPRLSHVGYGRLARAADLLEQFSRSTSI